MSRNWWIRSLFLLSVVILSVLIVIPTLSRRDLSQSSYPFKQKMSLGLDLQGGLYLVLGVEFNKVFKEVVDRKGHDLVERLKEKGVTITESKLLAEGEHVEDPKFQFSFAESAKEQVHAIFKSDYPQFRLTADSGGRFEVGLSHEYRGDVREKTINQSIEVIRNRIDEFGVSEPSISSQGNSRILVELPGVKDVERAKGLIGRTARLEFKLVDDKAMSTTPVHAIVDEIEKTHQLAYKEGESFSAYVAKINELAKSKIPEGDEIAFERGKAGGEFSTARVPYILKAKTEVSGDELSDAQVQFDSQTRKPSVGFSLNPRGASLFEKLTGDHIHDRLAIVLDGWIHSAPVIQSKIGGGHGQITLGNGQDGDIMQEAKDLAIVLRAGALPAQLELLEQRVVGPSLGQDSITKGAYSGMIGVLFVFFLVLFYYRASGAVAVLSLVLNVLFVMALLVVLEATLTLPGIAGIALTVGIAVDSNVVIYERIREEIRSGKSIRGAVEAGFQKAFRTIMDANVTNAAAAVVLLLYGTGPIKGFAVTMIIGIITTLFTAVFVCRLLFDWYLKRIENQPDAKLSI